MPIQMFDDGHREFQENVKEFGQAVGGLLKDRLHKKQFEDFLAGPTKDFKDQMQHANDLLMDETNPEAPSQGMQMLKGALESYMDEGARYADNPIIQNRVAQAFKVNMDFLNMEYKIHHDNAMAARLKVKDEREAAKSKADISYTEAGTQERLANATKAKADAAAKEEKTSSQGAPLFSGQPGSIDPMQEDDARVGELWNRIENSIDRPKSEAERKSVDIKMGEIRTQMAQQKLAEMVGRGEQHIGAPLMPGEKGVKEDWNLYNQKHLADVATTIDPAEVRNKFVYAKAMEEGQAHGISPELLDKRFGVVVDPTKASTFRPLSEPVSSENLGKVLFGVGGWNRLQDQQTKARPKDLKEATTRLPDDINQVSGPIAAEFQKFMGKELPDGIDPTSIKTVADMRSLLAKRSYGLITAVIGNKVPSNSLNEGMKKNRLEAKSLVDAMLDKYAQQVFDQFSGKAPEKTKAEPKGKTDKDIAANPVFGGAARRVGAITSGLLKPVKGAYKAFTED